MRSNKRQPPYARKRFGQHFLSDSSVVRDIVASARVSSEDHILEIGPGRGALTRELLNTSAAVTAIEIDRDLSNGLKETFTSRSNFNLITEDVLKADWTELLKQDVKFKLVANLPYNISTPFFFKLIKQRDLFISMTLMIQKEVAERIVHNGEGKDLKSYGILSVIAKTVFESELLFKVPPSAFSPQPKVDSVVICLRPKKAVLEDEDLFFGFIRRAFNQRRKLLITHIRNNEPALHNRLSSDDRQYLENLRPENLSPEQYLDLFRYGTVKRL